MGSQQEEAGDLGFLPRAHGRALTKMSNDTSSFTCVSGSRCAELACVFPTGWGERVMNKTLDEQSGAVDISRGTMASSIVVWLMTMEKDGHESTTRNSV